MGGWGWGGYVQLKRVQDLNFMVRNYGLSKYGIVKLKNIPYSI